MSVGSIRKVCGRALFSSRLVTMTTEMEAVCIHCMLSD